MNKDKLQYADLLELLIDGPVGEHRRWAAFLVLRMLETRGVCPYRDESRLGGLEHAQTAIASLRAAVRVLSESERGLLLRTVLLASWEGLRRGTGLSLRVPEILDEFVEDLGISPCLAAAQSVIERRNDAVRRYPLDGLLPEVRRPGEGMIVTFDARESRILGASVGPIEIDRLTIAVRSFHASGWEANLRPMVAWWLETQGQKEADHVARRLLADLRRAAQDEEARWRALGLLDWLAVHPDHPRAGEAMSVARGIARSEVRKAAADLAAVLGQWAVLEGLALNDRDRGVRQRAAKLLSRGRSQGWPGGQGQLFG
jgi:hypothetical protein